MTSFVLPHEVHGDGAHKVFAVHGWFADRAAYAAVLPDLDRAAFTYVLVDLRGYGAAKGAAGAFGTAEAAADLLELAGRLGWERFSVVGHSMGGAVAQRLLALAPERLRRIVGVSPVPASGLRMPAEQWKLFANAAHEPANRRTIIDVTTGGRAPAAWLDRMVARSLAHSDATAFRAWFDSWATEDFHTEVTGSTVPALAVAGALDPALTAGLLRETWLRWYPHGSLLELPSAGHYAMDEAPLDLIRAMEDFLRADEAEAEGHAHTTAKTEDHASTTAYDGDHLPTTADDSDHLPTAGDGGDRLSTAATADVVEGGGA